MIIVEYQGKQVIVSDPILWSAVSLCAKEYNIIDKDIIYRVYKNTVDSRWDYDTIISELRYYNLKEK